VGGSRKTWRGCCNAAVDPAPLCAVASAAARSSRVRRTCSAIHSPISTSTQARASGSASRPNQLITLYDARRLRSFRIPQGFDCASRCGATTIVVIHGVGRS